MLQVFFFLEQIIGFNGIKRVNKLYLQLNDDDDEW